MAGITRVDECPDCHSSQIKFHSGRKRRYTDILGEKKQSNSIPYQCRNRECRTKYFTRSPDGVELHSRVHRDVKKMVLRWSFHLRGTLSRARDELAEHGIGVALTTVLRWIKKAGEECVNVLKGTSKNHLQKDADRRKNKHNRVFRAGAACPRCPNIIPPLFPRCPLSR